MLIKILTFRRQVIHAFGIQEQKEKEKENRQDNRKQSNKMRSGGTNKIKSPFKSPMKCVKAHSHKPSQQCIYASEAQCANSMCSRTASCGKHGSFTIQLKMHETMKNQSRWNWKTLNCAFQLQNNDNNNTQRQTLKGMHTRVLEVVKDKEKKRVKVWLVEWKAIAVEEVY